MSHEHIPDYLAHATSREHWLNYGSKRRFGVCVPLSALRTNGDFGIGDTGGLKRMVDWCNTIGASVIQVLPIYDMGLDAVPYSALSAFAIDPVYMNLSDVGLVLADEALVQRVGASGDRLNDAQHIDYQKVRGEKLAILEQAFGQSKSAELMAKLTVFRQSNPWLEDYLVYRCIKEVEGFRSWEDWGPRYATDEALERFVSDHQERIDFHLFLQYELDRQFQEAKTYANERGVLLKGDIPILVSRDSADVWRNQQYFRMDTSAGAPPDMYAEDGQNWGFPTYDWDALAKDDYGWWRNRLAQAQRYFDLYRIDHVVGFFRIWTIPQGEKNGRNGTYVPQDEDVWGQHGHRLLSMMLESSPMLPLAEDLGTIPHVCRNTLRDMGICGLKVQRWEKRWEGDGTFVHPRDFHPLSLSTLSTHDSETLSGWWEAYPGERQQLWETLGRGGPSPATLPPDFHVELIRWLCQGRSMFVVLMLQELLEPFGFLPGQPSDHRINVPGTVNSLNWTWRCPVTTDELLDNEPLCRQLKELVTLA
jgi:4-alpha-glucanotransferase